MARELIPHDADSIDELLQLVEEVVETGERRIFRGIVTLSPIQVAADHPRAKPGQGRRTAADDPLWKLTGLVDTNGPGDVARDVDRYLADAHAPPRQ